jgi:hypothetical protein
MSWVAAHHAHARSMRHNMVESVHIAAQGRTKRGTHLYPHCVKGACDAAKRGIWAQNVERRTFASAVDRRAKPVVREPL